MNSFPIKNQGFTLLELIVSISILSLLLFTGAYSYGLMSERWNRELGQFTNSTKDYKHLELVQRLLEGVQPYVVVDSNQKPSFFFIGDNNSLLGISRSGFFSGEYPEIFRLSIVNKENDKVDLIYQSVSSERILLKGTDQSIDFSHQLILFSSIDKVQFSYYGWPHLFEKNAIDKTNKRAQWFERFSGIDNQIMPEKFNMTLTRSGKNLSIPIQLEVKPERWLSPYFKENQ
jgi:prepilin-type N-terminal cleavage/methylation domain-containing protein